MVLCFQYLPLAEDKYITSTEDFINSLKKGISTIYVGDIDFGHDTAINLNYNVNIVGRSKKSTIKNACFSIIGSNVPGEEIVVSFNNVILDGGIERSNYDFSTEGRRFDDVFGSERTQLRAIYGSWGYFTLNMDNCEIQKYASYSAPAMYIDNNATFREGKRVVNLKNSKFHDNICYEGVIELFNDNGVFNIDNCLFTHNLAKAGSGAVLSNGDATVTDSDFVNNDFYRFVHYDGEGNIKYPDDKMTINNRVYNYTGIRGALYIGAANAVVKRCRITDNKGLYGGGVGITSPEAVVGGETIEFIDCEISRNTATCGGGIYTKSNAGHTISFINCNIFGNKATQGGIMFTTTMVPYGNYVGGYISFVFCSMAENTDNDGGSFDFYETRISKQKGTIELLGSLAIDNANCQSSKYSYIANREKAISDGVVNEAKLSLVHDDGLSAMIGSVADVSVSADEYSAWATCYQKATESKYLGASLSKNIGYSEVKYQDSSKENKPSDVQSKIDENQRAPQVSSNAKSKISDKTIEQTDVTSSEQSTKLTVFTPVQEYLGSSILSNNTSSTILKPAEENKTSVSEVSSKIESNVSSKSVFGTSKNRVSNKGFNFWWIIIAVGVLAAVGVSVYLFVIKPKENTEESIEETVEEQSDIEVVPDFSTISYEELSSIVVEQYKKYNLTKKELQIATLLLICEKRKDIADQLFVSDDTVKTHISHIFKKVGVSSREEFRNMTWRLKNQ